MLLTCYCYMQVANYNERGITMANKKKTTKKTEEVIAEQIPLSEVIAQNKGDIEAVPEKSPKAEKKPASKKTQSKAKKPTAEKEEKPSAEPKKSEKLTKEEKSSTDENPKKKDTKKKADKPSTDENSKEAEKKTESKKKPTSSAKKTKKESPKEEAVKKEAETEQKTKADKKADGSSKKEASKTPKPSKESKPKEAATHSKEKATKEKPSKASEPKAEKKTNSKGYLDSLEDKKKLLDEAFADIENQLKELNVEKDAEPKKKAEPKKEAKPEPKKVEKPVKEVPVEETKKVPETKVEEKSGKEQLPEKQNKAEEKPVEDKKPVKSEPPKKEQARKKPAAGKSEKSKEQKKTQAEGPKAGLKKPEEVELSKTGKMKEKIIYLPATGKLSDVQGEDTDDFIEVIDHPTLSAPKNDGPTADAHIKPLPKIVSRFVPVQGDGVTEIIRKGFVVICTVLLLVCLGVLISGNIGKEIPEGSESSFIDNYVTKYVLSEKPDSVPNDMLESYYTLYRGNRETAGWLSLPDTPIDLVVLQAKDNDKYKTKDFYEEPLSGIGAYVDYRCNLKQFGKTTILYVVEGSDVTEISGVDKYHNLEKGATLPNIKFGTVYKDYEWKIVGCSLLSDATNVLYTAYETPNDFLSWLEKNNVYEKQMADYDGDDKFLIISIPYTDFETDNSDEMKTMILVAKLVK